MLPGEGRFSADPRRATYLEPDNLNGFGRLVDYERGGFGLNDTSRGLDFQNWRVSWDSVSKDVNLTNDLGFARAMFKAPELTAIALSFDVNMTPYFAYTAAGFTWLRWLRSDGGYETMAIPGAQEPRLTLDDKRPEHNLTADVLMFYLRAGNLCMRVQREGFLVENIMATDVIGTRLGRVGMTDALRLQVELLP